MVFRAAQLKIERAKQHIADLEVAVRSLPDAYTCSVQVNARNGYRYLRYTLPDKGIRIRQNLALIIGDAIHNLRTALDFSWVAMVEGLSLPDEFKKFPILPSKQEFEAVLRKRQIDTACRPLYRILLDRIKPYRGGNDAIWAIHALDIRDKHHLLLPLLHYSSVSGVELQHKSGRIERGDSWGMMEGTGTIFLQIPNDFDVKEKGRVAGTVMLNEATLEHGEATDTLLWFADTVLNVVQILEQIR